MRFQLGAIPSSPDFVPDALWRPLRHAPAPWKENLLALPIGVVAAVAVAALWFLLTPLRDIVPPMSLSAFLLLLAGSRLSLHSTLSAPLSTCCRPARCSFRFQPLRLSASRAGGYSGGSMRHSPPNQALQRTASRQAGRASLATTPSKPAPTALTYHTAAIVIANRNLVNHACNRAAQRMSVVLASKPAPP